MTKPTTITIEQPTEKELSQETKFMVMGENSLVVDTQDKYNGANELLVRVKSKWKDLDAERKDLVGPLNETVKKINVLYKKPLGILKTVENNIKSKMIAFKEDQERLRRQEEARARKEQRQEQERLRHAAKEARIQGESEEAELLEQEADMVPNATLVVEDPKAKGSTTYKTWYAEVDDPMALIKAVAEGKAPMLCLQPNMQELNKLAKALKGEFNIPGVVAKSKSVMSTRTNR